MDAYIDVVSGEIRALILPESVSTPRDSGDFELQQNPMKYGSKEFERRVSWRPPKNVNRPMALSVAALSAVASCSLAACWVAITVDCLKMLKIGSASTRMP